MVPNRPGGSHRIAHGLSVWAILFFSKFVFLEVLDLAFGDAVEFASFVWLMIVLVVVVVLRRVLDLITSVSVTRLNRKVERDRRTAAHLLPGPMS